MPYQNQKGKKMKKLIISLSVLALVFSACESKPKEQVKKTAPKAQKLAQKQESKKATQEQEPKQAKTVKTQPKQEKPKVAQAISGAELFAPCKSCHGSKAEKKALGRSQVIALWSEQNIINALKGYKAKTYGGAMKNMMYGQVSKLNDEQIKALAKHIKSF